MKLTVFTPTYNRGELLERLYQSLCVQDCADFCWLIVDDGSEDQTEKIVKNYIEEEKIKILYYKQQNSGKHVAHNLGVELCTTELFFCVDSDDYLTQNAINDILEFWNKITEKEKEKLSGIVAYRGTKKGEIIGTDFPENIKKSPLSKLYKLGKKGDTALIFRTEILKKYPFPVFDGEKFLRENLVYDQIDEEYSLLVLRKIIYIGEYLDDGLSKNATFLEMKSPKGAALYRYNEYLKNKKNRYGIRQLAGYIFFSIKGGNFKNVWKQIGIVKCILLLPVVFVGVLRYKIILKE